MMTFMDLLRAIEDGKLLEQLDEEMAAAVRGALKTGVAGELTLKITFAPEDNEMRVSPKVNTKIPSAVRRSSTFFVTLDGELTRNPVQQPLFRGSGAHA